MKKSNFQFTNPILKRIEFETHDSFIKKGKLNMNICLTVNIQRAENDDGTLGNEACVTATLTLGTKDDTTPFYLEADEGADFRWADGAYDEKQIEYLLNQNAVALLISYLRPIVSSITVASPYPAYNLPYIDLTSSTDQ